MRSYFLKRNSILPKEEFTFPCLAICWFGGELAVGTVQHGRVSSGVCQYTLLEDDWSQLVLARWT